MEVQGVQVQERGANRTQVRAAHPGLGERQGTVEQRFLPCLIQLSKISNPDLFLSACDLFSSASRF